MEKKERKREAVGVVVFSWNELEIVLSLAASHAVGCIQGP